MATTYFDLKPNKSFIDYDFDKYQLSLEKLKVIGVNLKKGIKEIELSDKQYSYQHFISFGIQNHLFLDLWSKHYIFWINKLDQIEGLSCKNVVGVNIKLQSKLYFEIPKANQNNGVDRLNPTLSFPSHNFAFVSDGEGHLYIIHTGDRGEDSFKWKNILKQSIHAKMDDSCNSGLYIFDDTRLQPSTILHSINRIDEATGRTILECLSLSVQEQNVTHGREFGDDEEITLHPPAHKRMHLTPDLPKELNGSQDIDRDVIGDDGDSHVKPTTHFVSVLQWDTYLNTEDGLNFVLEHRRVLEAPSSPNYAAIDPSGRALHILSDIPYKFVYDSKVPITPLEPAIDAKKSVRGRVDPMSHVAIDGSDSDKAEGEPIYYWSQTGADLTLKITLPETTKKEDIRFQLTPSHVKVSLQTGDTADSILILEGTFREGHEADVENSTWILSEDGKSMEVILSKNIHAGHDNFAHSWPNPPLQGPFKGQMDPEYMKSLLDRMDAFTEKEGVEDSVREKMTDNQVASEDNRPLTQPYNMQELEECDAYPQDTSLVGRYCGHSHCISHQASLSSNKYLFSCNSGDPKVCPAFCLRYDVHATIWQPTPLPLEGSEADRAWDIDDGGDMSSAQRSDVSPWINVGAFNAFGYVLASKEGRKFTGTSPDPSFHYAAISDSTNHVFIYWHTEYDASSSPTKNVLRNRKSGKVIEKVSKQQVVTLGLDDGTVQATTAPTILGMACLKNHIAVLTKTSLYIIYLV